MELEKISQVSIGHVLQQKIQFFGILKSWVAISNKRGVEFAEDELFINGKRSTIKFSYLGFVDNF